MQFHTFPLKTWNILQRIFAWSHYYCSVLLAISISYSFVFITLNFSERKICPFSSIYFLFSHLFISVLTHRYLVLWVREVFSRRTAHQSGRRGCWGRAHGRWREVPDEVSKSEIQKGRTWQKWGTLCSRKQGPRKLGRADFDVRREFPLVSFCLLSQVGNWILEFKFSWPKFLASRAGFLNCGPVDIWMDNLCCERARDSWPVFSGIPGPPRTRCQWHPPLLPQCDHQNFSCATK